MNDLIGVGMTTRNRPKTLALALRHFDEFPGYGNLRKILVDDWSDREARLENRRLASQYGWEYVLNGERRGVAKAKNRALNQIRECDRIFLFEDDCWPIRKGWDHWFINRAIENGCSALNAAHENGMRDDHIVGPRDKGLFEVANSTGYLMYWSNGALAELGGYDSRMGLCGGEDTQMNLRCAKAGFKPAPYVGPDRVGDWFYQVDLDWRWAKEKRQPPFGKAQDCEGSALTGEEKATGWAAGSAMVHEPEIYREPIE